MAVGMLVAEFVHTELLLTLWKKMLLVDKYKTITITRKHFTKLVKNKSDNIEITIPISIFFGYILDMMNETKSRQYY